MSANIRRYILGVYETIRKEIPMGLELKRVLVHIAEDQIERLDEVAEQTKVSRAAHIRLAITEYLRKQERAIGI